MPDTEQVIDLLLINPPPSYKDLTNILKKQGISYQLMVTNGLMLSYVDEPIIDLNTEPLDHTRTRWAHVFFWDRKGLHIAKFLSSKGSIILPYSSQLGMEHYNDFARVEENSAIVGTISFDKTHVLSHVLVYNNGQWVFFKNQDSPFFKHLVTQTLNHLDSAGIATGVFQTVISKEHKRFKFGPPMESKLLAKLQKNYTDIFPMLLKQSSIDVTTANATFTEWANRYGDLDKFTLNQV